MNMSMTFLSDPRCLIIAEPDNDGPDGFYLWTRFWRNFAWHNANDHVPVCDIIKKYNGTLENKYVMFETEQDKVWFILRWT